MNLRKDHYKSLSETDRTRLRLGSELAHWVSNCVGSVCQGIDGWAPREPANYTYMNGIDG